MIVSFEAFVLSSLEYFKAKLHIWYGSQKKIFETRNKDEDQNY